jgi:mono/diheme cytochrome c family protein
LTAPKVGEPVSLRIQHPSSNFPKQNETLQNPFRNPTEEMIGQFVEEAKAGTWNMVYTDPMLALKKQLESGTPKPETAKAAYMDRLAFEGRVLYQKNCRPCHGVLTDGNGPMADGFKLRPINFTDNGTIETVVEGYTFWRVRNGGPGLPVEATPWDSAMPIWKNDLTDDQIWKIILAEYDTAEKSPRIPEKIEHAEE